MPMQKTQTRSKWRSLIPLVIILMIALLMSSSISFAADPQASETDKLDAELVAEATEFESLDSAGRDCKTDPLSFWVCSGDVAWGTGYLVEPEVFDMRLLPVWERRITVILPRLRSERDVFRAQRDRLLAQLVLTSEDLKRADARVRLLEVDNATLLAELEESYGTLDLTLAIGAGFGVGVIAGLVAALLL